MKNLNNYELNEINGGAAKWVIAFIVGGVVSFLAGVVDGIMNPIKCRG